MFSSLQALSSFFLPNMCSLCKAHAAHFGMCETCEQNLPWQKHACPKCREPMPQTILCGRCVRGDYFFDQVFAPLRYEGEVKTLVSDLKFNEKLALANFFIDLLQKHVPSFSSHEKPDLLLPVPLHVKRLQARGFNQALEIAKGLSKYWQIPLARKALKKRVHTLPQSQQSLKLRQKNLHHAFQCEEDFTGKHIALIDDVITTGNTASEIAKTLKKSGASRVTVIAVAHTPK